MIQSRKSSLLVANAARPVVDTLEQRRLLSATLSVSSSLMVFNAVENSSPSQVETLTLTDTGDATLTLGTGSITIANDPSSATQDAARFALVNASSIPATLSPGASFGLEIDYSAITVTDLFNSAILGIASNDLVNPNVSVTLHGIGTKGLGGSNQPSLATILQSYDIPTYVGEGLDDANAATDSTYPYPPDSSTQEAILQRFVKAGTGPVTINVLASFTASGAEPYTLGTYTPGDPTSLNQLFTTPSTESQSTYVQPQGATSFDPGSSEFGFYCVSNVQVTGRIIYSEDALNTFDSTTGRHFRFFPMEQPNGTIVPNQYIMTSTEWNAPIGYDFTNIVAIVSNIVAAPSAPSAPVLGLQNLNAEPGSNTMVFARIQNPNTSIGDTVHDTGTLQVNNTGEEPLIISSYTLSSEWELVNPPTFPVTVAAGADLDLSIKFIATAEPTVPYNETNEPFYPDGGGVYDGTLVLNSNDPNNLTATVPLAGYWQYHSQNSNEPSFQTLVNLMFGWSTGINSTPIPDLTESLSIPSSPTYYGQETVSSYWAEADPALSVTVQEIASWHTQGNSTSTYWFPESNTGSKTKLFETGSDDGQSLFPLAINKTTPAASSFTSSGPFGFWFDTESSVDALNTGDSDDGGHHVRFFPVISATGALIPNTYIAAMDYSNVGGQNFDFNDNAYLITNIHPVTNVSGITAPQSTAAPAAPTDLYAVAASGAVNLQWAPVQDSTLQGYNVYSSLSANSGFSLVAGGVTQTSFTDTTAPAGTVVYYRVAAVDSNSTISLGTQAVTTTLGTVVTGLQSLDIGATPSGSTTVVTAGSAYDVTAGGPGVTGNTDGFRFVYDQETGDFDVKVQVQSITVAGNFSTAGIMARSTLDTGSPDVYMSASPVNYRFKDRATEDATTALVVGGTTSFPGAWVRLDRVGNVFNGYSSPDGISWTPVSSVTLALPDTLYLGLAVASNNTTQTTTAQLASYSNTSSGPVTVPYSATAISGAPTVINVLSVDSDPTGTIDPTTVTITTPPNQGGSAVVNSSIGTITYTSAPGFTGTETFSYTVGDDSATSQPAVVTVTVSPSGLVTNPVTYNVVAGQTLLANVLASDTDSTGTINPATLAIAGDVMDPNATVLVQSGEISYTPNAGFTGTDTVTYTVQDSIGVTSLPTTVTFIVTSDDTGPITNPVSATAISGVPVVVNVLGVDTDSTGTIDPSTVTITTPPNHGGQAIPNSNGTITYTSATGFTGIETFSYTVGDGSVISQSTIVTMTISLSGLVTNPATFDVVEGQSLLANVLASDTDSNGTINPATLEIQSGGAANPNGTAVVQSGEILFTPVAGFVGDYAIAYTIQDSNGVTSAPTTVTFIVTNSDTGPIANPVSAGTASGHSIQINVLASDSSTDGLNPATVTVVSNPGHGTTVVDTGTGIITYTPAIGFSGTDLFTYTVEDDNGVVSQPGTVTITVTATASGPVAANITSPTLTGNGPVTINVLAQAADGKGALKPASVTITTAPLDGTAIVNASNGAITYMPNAGFVGTDTLDYTVGDGVNTSSPAAISLEVGVAINTTTAKSLTFVDASGSRVTLALTGGGTGEIFFTGSGTSTNLLNKRGTSGTVSVNGTGLGISAIDITGTTAASSLTLSRKGHSVTALGGLTITGSINRIIAPDANLTGTLAVSGTLNQLQLASANGATITVGTSGKPLTFTAGNVTNTSLTSATPIKSLKVISWTDTGDAESITAPSISSLTTTSNFQARLNGSGGSPVSLGTVRIGGQVAADTWIVTSLATSITFGSIAAGWTGDFSGTINSFSIRAGGFAGTLTAGTIGTLTITGNDTGKITAGTIRSAKVVGELSDASFTLTNGVSPKVLSLGHLTITGQTIGSTIHSAGNIGAITTAGISNSSIDAGVISRVTLPTMGDDFIAAAEIESFSVIDHGSTFANTRIGATTIGSLSLGEIITASSSTPFGIGAGTIKSLSASLDSGGVLRLNTLALLSSNSIAAYVAAHDLNLNAFAIHPGL